MKSIKSPIFFLYMQLPFACHFKYLISKPFTKPQTSYKEKDFVLWLILMNFYFELEIHSAEQSQILIVYERFLS